MRCCASPSRCGSAVAQLSDDCFAFAGPLLSVEAARALIEARVAACCAPEEVALRDAAGRALAEDVVAPQPLPPFFNSAVDGYAFRHADLSDRGETRLPLDGRTAAGERAAPLPLARARRIFTGAPMPEAADTVVMQEDARAEGDLLVIPPGLRRGANCRPPGEDVPCGAVALAAGTLLRAPEIGLAAALGFARLPVRARLRVGVFSTGDELAAPGAPLGPAQTYDSNRFALMALLARLPCAVADLGILPDDAAATARALREASSSHDLLVTSGGVSAGEEDHVRAAIEGAGSLVFWRLAVKPGRPAAMGVVAGTPVVGLPGNPVAAVVCFLHLVRPLALRLIGAHEEPLPLFAATARFAYRKKKGRREYVRVTLDAGGGAEKFPREGAGLLTSLTQSHAFAELPEGVTDVAPGDALRVLPFAAIF